MTSHRRIAFRMTLHSGMADEYRRRHDALWPELALLLRDAGVHDYGIWLDPETNALFAVLTLTPDGDLAALPDHPVMKRWWAYMADIMVTNADDSPAQVDLAPMFYFAG